ncbi:protein mannan synthesis-related 1 [Quercus suber]|uniref:Protein mannan synthesis-related 1 n=1 Tax=Quercus suber TaxID=58331 RepID=A0AAW0M2Z0_QUESU
MCARVRESIMPVDKKAKFLDSKGSEYEKSDVLVLAISGLFYSNVVGRGIAANRIQTLVLANIRGSSSSASDFITPSKI